MDQVISEFIKNKSALVVEDEPAIAQLLNIHLTKMGFAVEVCHDAESALVIIEQKRFELCLLDWMLPGLQGVDFLRQIRPKNREMKIMMVTAKADPESIVDGLDSGADDYLPKPFDAIVLVARVRQLLRRLQLEQQLQESHQPKEAQDKVSFDQLTIHFSQHTVQYMNNNVHLTFSEFKLLEALFKAQGQVLTREKLIDSIQGDDVSVTERTIDTHIFALRKKIGAWSKHIETVRGVGYRILIAVADASEEVL